MSRAQPRGGARNPGSGAVVAENANWDALDRLVDEDQQDIDQIVASDVTSDPVAPSDGNDPLWNDLRGRNDGFNKFTRFTEQELENIWIDMQEEVASRRRRGPVENSFDFEEFSRSFHFFYRRFDKHSPNKISPRGGLGYLYSLSMQEIILSVPSP